MRRKLIKVALVLGLLAALGAGAYYLRFHRPLTLAVVRPEPQTPVQVYGLGTVEARIISRVGFKAAGTLVELKADHGDLVAKGALLARLDGSEQERRVAKAQANMAKAQAGLKVAEANLAKARTILAQREQVSERRQALLKTRALAEEAAQEAQTAMETARAELAVITSEVVAAQAGLKDAEAQVELEKVLLAQFTLTAPFDAVVVTRHKELGAVLAQGEPLYTLLDPATVWVRAFVDEARAGGLKVGQPAEIRLRSLPRERFQGRIVRLDLESDRVSEERKVYVACDHGRESFFLGEQAEVFITTDRAEGALFIPRPAVEGFDGSGGLVWAIQDGRLTQVRVTLGRQTLDGRLELLAGLPAGAAVVAQAHPGLREGRLAAAEAAR